MAGRFRQALLGLGIGAAGASVGYAVARAGGDLVGETPGWALLAAFVAGPVLAVAVHELGHLLAGVLNGMRPVLYLVGPAQVEWRDGRASLSLNRSVAMAGGLTVCLPPDGRFRRNAMSWYVAGGPIASFALALAAFAAGAAGPSSWAGAWYVLGLFSLAITLVTAVPLPGAITNDATRFRMIRAGDDSARRWLAMVTLTGLAMTGVRPREWPDEAVAEAAGADGGSASDLAAGWLLATYAFVDRGDEAGGARTAARIESVLDELPGNLRLLHAREAATLALRRGERRAVAPELADASRRALLEEGWEVPRLRAYLARADGRDDETRAMAAAALCALDRTRMPGVAAMVREELEALARG